jgi:plastocyanin
VAAITAGAVVTGVVAGAAGGGASQLAASPTTTATLVAQNTKYAPTAYEMSSSDVLGLFVENRDSTTHSFDIDALDIHVQVPANSTVAVAIKPTGSGPLEFYCAIGGHKAAGMDGTIRVS